MSLNEVWWSSYFAHLAQEHVEVTYARTREGCKVFTHYRCPKGEDAAIADRCVAITLEGGDAP